MTMKKWLLSGVLLVTLAGAGGVAGQPDLSQCDVISGDWESIVTLCGELIDMGGVNGYAYWVRGYAYSELSDYEQAVSDYTKALSYFGKDANAFINRGWAYTNLGMVEEALRDYNSAILLEPTNQQALINRGYLFRDTARFEEALADADRLTALGTDNVNAYIEGSLLAGIVQLDQSAFAEAIAAFEEAARYSQDDSRVSINLGYAYWSAGDFAAAAPWYRAYIGLLGEDFPLELTSEALLGEPFEVTLDGGRYYEVPLSLNEGDLLTVSAVTQDDTLDPALVLTDARGDALWADDDTLGGEFGLDALIDGFEVPETGEYTLVLGFAGGGQTGTMDVQISITPAAE